MTALAAGWQALSRGRWEEALALLRGSEDDPEALEAVGIAHWWLDDADATLEARERAYRLYRERGDGVGAARVAFTLASDSLLFGGLTAVARGWLERSARLLAREPTCPEHAWLAVHEAEVALNLDLPEEALAAARRALVLGEELGNEDVQLVARSLEGFALVQEGAVADGMRRLDESAAAATAGEIENLLWTSKVCCNLITACEKVGDIERATQWCEEVKRFAQRWQLRVLFSVCRTQYASVLLQQGVWQEAEQELTAALEVLGTGRRTVVGEGVARLGELRRRQGRLDEARALFAQSELHSTARLGTVALALDEGDAAAALALAERLERSTGADQRLSRIEVLLPLVRAAIVADRPEVAAAAVEELEALAETVGTNRARAAAARAAGLLGAATGELEDARRRLEDAIDLYGLSLVPYERAHTRLALARVLHELGATEHALAEAGAARTAFEELSARRDTAEAVELLRCLEPARRPGPLTPREVEVLALVSAGRSNREIAARLVVSEHTVHRHVANILRKLGEPTRAAAAARAARDGLV